MINFVFYQGSNKQKTIPIYLKVTSTSKQNAFVKLINQSTSKMIAVLCCSSKNLKGKIADGKQNFAALRILDSQINRCFLDGSFQPESLSILYKMLKSNQCFYEMKLPNINMCFEQCYKVPYKCQNFKKEDEQMRCDVQICLVST